MKLITDTLQNLVSGLFTPKDKAAHDRYVFAPMDIGQLRAAYRGDWIARKVVDVPAFDMTRAWRTWKAEEDQIEAIEGLENSLGIRRKVFRALIRSRLYGGSALILGVANGLPSEELVLDQVGKDALKYVHVASRHELTAGSVIRDVNSPWYGEPSYYQVKSTTHDTVFVHPSRVVRFVGNEMPDIDISPDGWGDSILEAVNDAVRSAGVASQGVASMIQEAKVDVIKVPRLTENLASQGYTNLLIQRFMLANQMKSINNTLLLDSEEEWDRKQTNFSQLPELIRTYLQIASGAADIPATRLLGQSPQGMNATGDSDIRNYYDRISSEQNVSLGPDLNRLDEIIIRSALGDRDDAIHYAWAPLWQLGEKEKADIAKTSAERDQLLINSGSVPQPVMEVAMRNRLIETGELPGIEQAYEDWDAGKLEEEEEPLPGIDPLTGLPLAPAVDPRTGLPVGDAAPRTLYVSRKVMNASAIIEHFNRQGLTDLEPANELHVTIAYSRSPVNWMEMGENWSGDEKGQVTINAGGPRMMDLFGDDCIVLAFASSMLSWRHEEMKRKGVTHDYPEYQPHITVAKGSSLPDVDPYVGEIVLGPEIFEEVKED